MYQNPPRYVPGPPIGEAETTTPRRSGLRRFLMPFLLLAALILGVSYEAMPEPDVEVRPGIAFTDAGLVLVPYERYGTRGVFQVLTQDDTQVRLAAADPGTGEVRWDVQLSDRLVWEATVLAGGRRLAYVATDSGLVIVDLADGGVVAEGGGVGGLGAAFAATPSAYAYDPQGRRILAENATGAVLAIPMDETTANPVDERTAAAWAPRLTADRAAAPGPTAVEAALPGTRERVALEDLPFGIPGRELVRVTEDGRRRPVGGTAFHSGSLVVNGVSTAHVLVQHQRFADETGIALSSVALDTGLVTATVDLGEPVTGAVAGREGTTAVAAGAVLALAHDGRITRTDLGTVGFFG